MVVLIGQRKALAMAVRNNPEKLINAPTGGLRADKPQLRTRTGAGWCFLAASPSRTGAGTPGGLIREETLLGSVP